MSLNINVETEDKEKAMKEQEKKWEVEDAVRCIIRAEEIKQDAELMKLVEPELKKKAKAMVDAANVLYGKNEEK